MDAWRQWKDYHKYMNTDDYQKRFRDMSDQELVEAFNREVGGSGWTSSRAKYLEALHQEFKVRGFDYSIIGDDHGLSFKDKVRLENNRIEVL